MTKVHVEWYDDIKVKSENYGIWLTVPNEEAELDPYEARELVKALEKHIAKVEEVK